MRSRRTPSTRAVHTIAKERRELPTTDIGKRGISCSGDGEDGEAANHRATPRLRSTRLRRGRSEDHQSGRNENRGSSPNANQPESRGPENRPSLCPHQNSQNCSGRRPDNSHIFVAHHDRHHAINACFCQQHRLQMSKYSPKAFVSASNITFLMR